MGNWRIAKNVQTYARASSNLGWDSSSFFSHLVFPSQPRPLIFTPLWFDVKRRCFHGNIKDDTGKVVKMVKLTMSTPWLPKTNENTREKQPIVCFPFAGGGSSFYYRWAQKLPPSFHVLPVRLPGRESRFEESPFESIHALADVVADVLGHALDGPFSIFGYSMGAILGFEVSRRLIQGSSAKPRRMIVVACRAPQLPNQQEPLHTLEDQELIDAIRSQFGGISDELFQQQSLIKALLPTIRADLKSVETYSFQVAPPLDIPILALGGASDTTVPLADLDAWREQTSAAFKLRTFPGGHFFFEAAQKSATQTIVRWLGL